jgi:hypothetical protein
MMSILEVQLNLERTIQGKQILLDSWKRFDTVEMKMMCQMLELNIDELYKIMKDVEKCCMEMVD